MSYAPLPTSIESTVGPVPLVTNAAPLTNVSQPRFGDVATARVLHLVNGEHFSGAERVQSHLGRCLPTSGITADFACVKPGKFADLLDSEKGKWGRGHRTPMSGRFDVRIALKIRDMVRSDSYDLLHAHTPRTAMVAAIASKLSGVPWIYHVHSPASRDSTRGMVNRINAAIEKYSLRSADHLITVSKSLRKDCVSRGTPGDSITVVHNGVPGIRPARESVPSPHGRWTIGMIALMRPRKGLEVALDALAHLREQGHNVVLRCIGPFETESYREQILAQIAELNVADGIEWVGFTKDVPAELAKLDAMVLPSLFGEGLPMVVLEAMAAAVPVIATRVEGTPEAVTDGVEGLLAEPRDAGSLANRITELVTGQHDWQTMAEAAFLRHERDFSDHAMAAGVAKVYRQVLANQSR